MRLWIVRFHESLSFFFAKERRARKQFTDALHLFVNYSFDLVDDTLSRGQESVDSSRRLRQEIRLGCQNSLVALLFLYLSDESSLCEKMKCFRRASVTAWVALRSWDKLL
jgi:hypothetical protein